MNTIKRSTAIAELLLLLPASLFMASLFVQHLEPVPLAGAAKYLVDWFSSHVVLGLYVFLVALPLTAFLLGCVAVSLNWGGDAGIRRAALDLLATAHSHIANLLIAGATTLAGGILAIVAMHMMTH